MLQERLDDRYACVRTSLVARTAAENWVKNNDSKVAREGTGVYHSSFMPCSCGHYRGKLLITTKLSNLWLSWRTIIGPCADQQGTRPCDEINTLGCWPIWPYEFGSCLYPGCPSLDLLFGVVRKIVDLLRMVSKCCIWYHVAYFCWACTAL